MRMSSNDFRRWLEGAPAGSVVTYFKGNLSEASVGPTKAENARGIRDLAWKAHEDGRVELTQQVVERWTEKNSGAERVTCLYLATKRQVLRR